MMPPPVPETEPLKQRFTEFGSVDTQSAMLSESLCYVSLCHVCQKYQTRKQSKDRIISGPRQGAEHKANECKQGDKNSC